MSVIRNGLPRPDVLSTERMGSGPQIPLAGSYDVVASRKWQVLDI
jgi:hypothetical protein